MSFCVSVGALVRILHINEDIFINADNRVLKKKRIVYIFEDVPYIIDQLLAMQKTDSAMMLHDAFFNAKSIFSIARADR